MLKLIGAPKLVEIRRIHIDGAAPVDMEKENVRDIERSIVENGNTVINPSWVDKKTSRIVQGRDRILAQMRFRKCALVQYVSGTEEEYARIQIEENLCRRNDDKGTLRAKLKAALAPSLAHPDGGPARGRTEEATGVATMTARRFCLQDGQESA